MGTVALALQIDLPVSRARICCLYLRLLLSRLSGLSTSDAYTPTTSALILVQPLSYQLTYLVYITGGSG